MGWSNLLHFLLHAYWSMQSKEIVLERLIAGTERATIRDNGIIEACLKCESSHTVACNATLWTDLPRLFCECLPKGLSKILIIPIQTLIVCSYDGIVSTPSLMAVSWCHTSIAHLNNYPSVHFKRPFVLSVKMVNE